jgi:hypothetical protein
VGETESLARSDSRVTGPRAERHRQAAAGPEDAVDDRSPVVGTRLGPDGVDRLARTRADRSVPSQRRAASTAPASRSNRSASGCVASPPGG